jgi:hypothetical protein
MTFGITAAGLATGLTIAGGVNSLTGGGVTNMLGLGPKSASGAQAQQMADPFSQYRGKLAEMYSGALQPGAPSNIEAMPGFTQYKTGVLDPAMEASKRSAASSGQLYSGAESAQLQKIGQQGYYGFMTDYLNRLATGSGAGAAPSTGAGMGLTQAGMNQQGFMQGMGGVATGLAGLFGNTAGPITVPTSETTALQNPSGSGLGSNFAQYETNNTSGATNAQYPYGP